MRWFSLVAFLFFLCVFSPSANAVKQCKIVPDQGDDPVKISGQLNEENAFVGNLRLTTPCKGGIDNFYFLPSDLQRRGDDMEIGRQNVALVGDPTLRGKVPKDFQLRVTDVRGAGTYEGSLAFLVSGQSRSEATEVDLTLVAKDRPELVPMPGTGQIQMRLVNCFAGLDCFLAGIILHDSASLNKLRLEFANPTQAPVTVVSTTAAAMDAQTRFQLTKAALTPPDGEQVFDAGRNSTMAYDIDRRAMPAGHYTGTIYVTMEGSNERLQLPVDLSVRTGPGIPILLLFLGILLGRLFRYMQERGRPQSDALAAVYRVQARVNAEANPRDQRILTLMVDEVRRSVYRQRLDTAMADLKAIEARLETLTELQRAEEGLAGKEQHPLAKQVLSLIEQARQRIEHRQDREAKELLDEVRQKLEQLSTTLMGSGRAADPAVADAAKQAEAARDAADRAERAAQPSSERRWGERIRDWLATVAGLSDQVRAEATLRVVRPLLYFALLLGLLALGLSSLYVDNGTTFGANRFADYLSLVLWGLSADVTGRTLADLPGGNAQA